MKNKYTYILASILSITLWYGCEDPIDVALDETDTLKVVDAFLNNNSEPQTISFSQSQSYFDNNISTKLSGATVQINSSSGRVFEFLEDSNGNYTWNPEVPSDNLGEVGDEFSLQISYEGDIYAATSVLHDAPQIDSITQELRDDLFFDGIYAEFFARDLTGLGNTYWIKTFKNGIFLNKPEEINIAYDASFDSGAEVDGLIFIPPIRELINPVVDEDVEEDSPWVSGDIVRVEIHSITNEAFNFMETARDQILNGFNGIFAEPLANSKGNIIKENSDETVLGVFCVSKITALEKIIE